MGATVMPFPLAVITRSYDVGENSLPSPEGALPAFIGSAENRPRLSRVAGDLKAGEGAREGGLSPREVDVALAPGQPALGAFSRFLSAVPVDLVRALGVLREHDDLVVADLGEAAGQGQVRLARALAIGELADAEGGQQRR